MDFVDVGHAGNAADTTGAPNPAGSVTYAYRMGRYEVSRDMINKANAAGGLAISLADMTTFGGNGPARPATGVSWIEAARFVNWLNTSSGHQPAYNIVAGSFGLWTSGEAWMLGGQNLFRHKDAVFFLPSESEWYKAAYYDPSAATYRDYPTGSDTAPSAVTGGTTAGTAVFGYPGSQGPADIMNAGGASPYGTVGQGGNVWEWHESALDGVNDSATELRELRGAGWRDPVSDLASAALHSGDPTLENSFIGFRVASVPEPIESATVVGFAMAGFALCRRRA